MELSQKRVVPVREVMLRTLLVTSLIVGVNSLIAQTMASWVVKYDNNGPGPEEINWSQVLDNDGHIDGTERNFKGDFVILILRKDRQLGSEVAFPLHCVNGFNPDLLRVFAWEYHGENQRVKFFQGDDLVYNTDKWKQTKVFIIDLSSDNALHAMKNQLQIEECREWSASGGYKVYENVSRHFIDDSQSDSRSSHEEQICWRLKNAIDILNDEAEKRSAILVDVEVPARSKGMKHHGRMMAGVRKSFIDSYSAANNMTLQSTRSQFNFELMVSKRMKGAESSLGIEFAPGGAFFETNWTPSEQSIPWNQDGVDGGVFFVEHNGVKEQVALDFLTVSGLWLKPVTIPKFDESNVILRFGVPLRKRQFSELTEGEFSYSASIPGVENRIRNVESMGLVDDVQVDPTWQTDFEFGGWLAGATLQVISGLGDDSSYYLSTSMDIHRWNISDSSMPIASISPTHYSSAMAGTSVSLVNLRVAAGIIFGR